MVSPLDAVLICEGVREAEDEQEYLDAWQTLLDTGIVWQLQGWYQRNVIDLLNQGLLTHPAER